MDADQTYRVTWVPPTVKPPMVLARVTDLKAGSPGQAAEEIRKICPGARILFARRKG